MPQEVDLDKIIRDKNPKMNKWLRKMLAAYLGKTIHVDEINYCLRNFSDLEGVDFARNILAHFNIQYSSFGFDGLDQKGRYIFAANHPLGGLDGLALAVEIGKYFGSVKIVVNDLLMNLGPLSSLFVPVNKHGGQTAEYARIMNEMYESDQQILYFPAGLCSRKIKGKIQDLPWKKSFISKAVQYERDVVPVHVDARNSNFFYNLANFRKRAGIKANIEMLYLPDEMIKQKGKRIDIIAGEPISYKYFTKEKSADQWANYVRKEAYKLKNIRE